MEYQINMEITSANDAEMLDALLWLKDNYGTKVLSGQGVASTKEISLGLIEATFNDTVTAITALKAQFGARLIEYKFIMSQ